MESDSALKATSCDPYKLSIIICSPTKSFSRVHLRHCASPSRRLVLVINQMERGKENRNRDEKSMEVGPWGGNGGAAWDDGVYNGLREIRLIYGHCIDSIQVVYDKNGKSVEAEKHGGVGGDHITEIKLKYPDEYLVDVSGYICPLVHGMGPVIRSLTLKTNKRTLGPFGMEEGAPFSFPVEGNRIVGVKGRSGWYLDAIGFHVCQVQPPRLLQRVNKTFKRLTSMAPSSAKEGEKTTY